MPMGLSSGFACAMMGQTPGFIVRFKRASILNGDTETIASYDSNDLPPSNKYELDSVDICGFEWDFYNFVYYVEARLQRDSSEGHPGLAAIQISELYCE